MVSNSYSLKYVFHKAHSLAHPLIKANEQKQTVLYFVFRRIGQGRSKIIQVGKEKGNVIQEVFLQQHLKICHMLSCVTIITITFILRTSLTVANHVNTTIIVQTEAGVHNVLRQLFQKWYRLSPKKWRDSTACNSNLIFFESTCYIGLLIYLSSLVDVLLPINSFPRHCSGSLSLSQLSGILATCNVIIVSVVADLLLVDTWQIFL